MSRGYRGLLEVTGGYRELQGVTGGYKGWVAGALACSTGVFYGRANVLFAKAHIETRKEGRKWGESPTLRVTIFTLPRS